MTRHHEKLMNLLGDPNEMMKALGPYARATQAHLDKAYNSSGPLPAWYKTVKQSMDDLGLTQILKQVGNAQRPGPRQ